MSYCRKKALLAIFCTLFTFRAPPLTPTMTSRPRPPLLRQLLLPLLRALLPMPPLVATARKKLEKSSEKRRRTKTRVSAETAASDAGAALLSEPRVGPAPFTP